ncbi:hypothetical protein CAPTEDRAFT_115189, partial [Capitella teleta]
DEPELELLKVDNAKVLGAQKAKLQRLRESRDEKTCKAALQRLTKAASGEGNLLMLALDAARARASLGEISAAMESVFGRYEAQTTVQQGIYTEGKDNDPQVLRAQALAEAFASEVGRPPRIVIAKMGQDGHDRGQKVVASAFGDFGFEVTLGSLFRSPEEVAEEAVKNQVDIIGVSSLAAGHLTLVPELRAELKKRNADHIAIVVGGVIPPGDFAALKASGVSAIFPPGTVISQAAADLLEQLMAKHGFTQPEVTSS